MLLTVTLNPAWDIIYHLDQLEPGRVHRVRSIVGRAGGKGINVARVARAMHHRVQVLAPVSGMRAGAFADDLAADQVPCILVPGGGELRQTIVISPEIPGEDQGRATVFNEPGPAITPSVWSDVLAASAREARVARVAVISGSLPTGVDERALAELVAQIHENGCLVFVDIDGRGMLWAARAGADLIKPKRAVLRAATKQPDIDEGAQVLLQAGAKSVVVTDAEEGLRLYLPDAAAPVMQAQLGRALVGFDFGAGDAAMAALAYTCAEPWETRVREAIAVSSASLLQPVAGMVDPADVERMRPDVVIS